MPMDRKKAIDSSKKAVTVFFKIRRGFKIYIAFITAVMLLILELIRKCVAFAKAKGLKLFEKVKERKSANEADKKEE